MLENEYDQIVHYLKGMISDGVQLVHGGHLFDWNDTNIARLLREIDRKKSEMENLQVEIAEPLVNRISGQRANVFFVDEMTVQMLPSTNTIIYPKDKIWYHYRKEEPGE